MNSPERSSHPVARASWWPSDQDMAESAGTMAPRTRTLSGEIRLDRDLKPTFSFYQYFVKVRCVHLIVNPFSHFLVLLGERTSGS